MLRQRSSLKPRATDRKAMNSFYNPWARACGVRHRRMSAAIDSSSSMQRLQGASTCLSLSSSSKFFKSTPCLSQRWSSTCAPVELAKEKAPEQKMGVILKAYDDCRQDTLALQVMHLLEVIWQSEGIEIPLMVYNVTPARTSDKNKAMGGIIECVGCEAACECRCPTASRATTWARRASSRCSPTTRWASLCDMRRSLCSGVPTARTTRWRCGASSAALPHIYPLWHAVWCRVRCTV